MDLNNVEFTWIKNKPENWETQRVKNHFILTKNKTETPQGYPILSLTMKGIVERDISSNKGQLPETYNGYYLLNKDDIVFNPMDLISGWVDCSPFEGLISPSYKVLRPISKNVNIKFYTYYFQTHYKEKIFFPFGEGVHYEYRWGLGTETLRNFPILVPPLSEQKQIVSYLDTKTLIIDSLIEKTQRKVELLKEKRNSLINEIITKGLNPKVEMKDSCVKWIGEIPNHYQIGKLKHLCNENQRSLTNSTDPNYELNYIEISDVNSEGVIGNYTPYTFSESPSRCRRIVQKGDVIVSTVRTYLKSIGLIEEEVDDLICSTGFCVLTPNVEINSKYLFYLLRTEWFISMVISKSEGVSYPSIQSEKLMNIDVVFCKLSEQKKIIKYLDEQTSLIDRTTSNERKRIELLKEYRQSLISEVVTGKRKVV